jgi:aminoglycoside phosphotransferase (APT) family kinase protein
MAKDTPEPWTRRHAFVALDDRELAAMLRPLFGERRVESAEPLTGGFVNTNYRVRLAGLDDAFVLRSYVRDAGACQRERDIIARVQGRVPVAEVLYADTRGEAFGRRYAVMRWIEGVALDQLLARPAEADPVALAACLAHAGGHQLLYVPADRLLRAGAGDCRATRQRPRVLRQLPRILPLSRQGRRAHRPRPDRRAVAARQRQRASAGWLGDSAALVHSDYKGSNLLLRQTSGRWEVAAVLDWEFAHAGTPLVDIGILLRDADTLPSGFAPAFAAAYRAAGGSLPTEWRQIAQLLDLMNYCEFLNGPDARGGLPEYALGRIHAALAHWDTYRA